MFAQILRSLLLFNLEARQRLVGTQGDNGKGRARRNDLRRSAGVNVVDRQPDKARDRRRIELGAKLGIALRHLAEKAVGLESNGNRPTLRASSIVSPEIVSGAESFSTLAVPSVG